VIRSDMVHPTYTIVDMARFLRRSRGVIGAGLAIGLLLGCLGVYMTPTMYTAATVVSPSQSSQQPTTLGGLLPPGLFGGLSDGQALTERAVATLKSREFLERFAVEHKLAPEGQAGDFYRSMLKRIDVVSSSPQIMTITVKWESPKGAAEVANGLTAAVNRLMRDRALEDSTNLIDYLQDRALETTDIQMRDVIYSLIHEQVKTQMMAKAKAQYVFVVVDPAYPPIKPSQPNTLLLLIGGLLGGLILGLLIAALRSVVRQSRLS